MSAPIVFVSLSPAGRCAVWLDSPPVLAPFRLADHVIDVGKEHQESIAKAAVRLLLSAERIHFGQVHRKWSSADLRVRRGSPDPWKESTPPSLRSWGEIYAGHRLRDAGLELLTAEEIMRIRELEALADRTIAAGLKSPKPIPVDVLREAHGVEMAIWSIQRIAFFRKHPPPDRDLFERGASPVSSHWSLLGIEKTRDVASIRAAWRRTALVTHPDRGANPDDFRRARAAYDACLAEAR